MLITRTRAQDLIQEIFEYREANPGRITTHQMSLRMFRIIVEKLSEKFDNLEVTIKSNEVRVRIGTKLPELDLKGLIISKPRRKRKYTR